MLHLRIGLIEHHQVRAAIEPHPPAPEVIDHGMALDYRLAQRDRVVGGSCLPLRDQRLVVERDAIQNARDHKLLILVGIVLEQHDIQRALHKLGRVMHDLREQAALGRVRRSAPDHQIILPDLPLRVVGVEPMEVGAAAHDGASWRSTSVGGWCQKMPISMSE